MIRTFIAPELPSKAPKSVFWLTISSKALDNISTIKEAARKIRPDYGIKDLIKATKEVFFPTESTSERQDELASLYIFSFESD